MAYKLGLFDEHGKLVAFAKDVTINGEGEITAILGLGGGSGTGFTDTSGALSIESSVADGASALAFLFDTTNNIANGSAKIFQIKKGSNVLWQLLPRGSVELYAADNFGMYIEGADGSYCNVDSNNYDLSSPNGLGVSFSPAGLYTFNAPVARPVGTSIVEVSNASSGVFAITAEAAAGQSNLMLWDPDNNTLQRVTLGAADSGGTGYRALRIPNAP